MEHDAIILNANTINILYLDDEDSDLKYFTAKATSYNRKNIDKKEDSFTLNVFCTCEHEEAITKIKSGEYNVFVCDQNMPTQKGFELVTYLKLECPDVLFVLYTGAGNLEGDMIKKCKENEILFFEKSES